MCLSFEIWDNIFSGDDDDDGSSSSNNSNSNNNVENLFNTFLDIYKYLICFLLKVNFMRELLQNLG
jgi:hypothetical protein